MWKSKKMKMKQLHGLPAILFSLFFIYLSSISASAAVPAPRLKPTPPAISAYMSEADAKQFRSAISAAKARRWSSVNSAISRINDPVAKDTLRWIQATNDRNVSTERLEYVHRNLSNWPRLTLSLIHI